MSARLLQKGITSALFHHQSNATPLKEILCDNYLFSQKRHQSPFLSIFNRAAAYQTQVKEDVEESDKMVEDGSKNNLHAALSDLKTSSRHDMAIVFTCKVRETRSVKTACRSSYDKGVVVFRCGGCNNMHLIADRLGWFGEPGSIEELLVARGEGFKTGSADTLNPTLDDLAGVKRQQRMESVQVPKKPHAIFLPFPFQSHINALLKVAKLFYFKGFRVTFVNTEVNHQKILRSRGTRSLEDLPDFRFKTIPDGLPSCDIDASQDIFALCCSVQTNFAGPFCSLVGKVNEEAISSDSPPVTCIISDACMSAQLVLVSEELDIPLSLLWCMSAAFLMSNLHYCGLLVEQEHMPPKEVPIDVNTEWSDIQQKGLQGSFLEEAEPLKSFLIFQLQGISKASAIIINTFDSFEFKDLEKMKPLLPPIYIVGPLQLLVKEVSNNQLISMGSNLWKEDEESLKWLDSKNPNSVVYVNFGSLMVLTTEQFTEFAWGLADSNYPFLWVIRPDLVSGENAILPPEFLKETADRGMISSWCPQEQVLCHSSTAAFLTHSGWNSTMDTICGGVPIISWPGFLDQQMNCQYSCFHWGIGMEMDKNVTRVGVKALVTELMEGEKGKNMKRKATSYKKDAEESTKPGGSSYVNLDRIVEVLTPRSD